MQSISLNTDYLNFVYTLLLLLSLWGVHSQRRELARDHSSFLILSVFTFALYRFLYLDHILFPGLAEYHFVKPIILYSTFCIFFIYMVKNHTPFLRPAAGIYPVIVAAISFAVGMKYGISNAHTLLFYILAFPVSLLALVMFFYKRSYYSENKMLFYPPALFIAAFTFSWLLIPHYEDYGNGNTGINGMLSVLLQVVSIYLLGLWFLYLRRIIIKSGRSIVSSYLVIVAVLIVMLGGGYYTEWRVNEAENGLKYSLLKQVRDISGTVDPALVRRLNFTLEDKYNPSFNMLRDQLVTWGRYANLKYIYSVAMYDGKFLSGPENIPPNSTLASTPGGLYTRSGSQLRGVFKDAAPLFIGPNTGEYGATISAFSPVIDSVTGDVILVIGADIDAAEWHQRIISVRKGAFGNVFAVLLIIFSAGVVMFLRDRRWRNRREFVLVHMDSLFVLLMGIMISIVIFTMFMRFDRNRVEGSYAYISDYSALAIHNALVKISNDAAYLSNYIENNESVTSDEFNSFVSVMTTSGIIGRGWAPAERINGKQGGGLKQKRDAGDNDVGIYPEKGYKFPVRFFKTSIPAGLHHGFELTSRETYRRAAEISSGVAQSVIAAYRSIDIDNARAPVMDIIRPVLKDRKKAPSGYIVSVIDINRTVADAMSFAKSEFVALSVNLFDLSRGDRLIVSYSTVADKQTGSEPVYAGGWYEYPVFIFNSVFCIRISRPQGSVVSEIPTVALMGGASGLMLSFSVFLLTLLKRRREFFLEEVIQAGTAELRESEERFRILSEATYGGIAIHENGIIIECNRGLAEMSGYTEQQLKGMNGFEMIAPDSREFVLGQMKSRTNEKYDTFAVRRDGTIFPVEVFGRDIPYKGRTLRVTEFRDITDRKHTEGLLKSQREEIEAANEELQAQMEEYEALNSELLDSNKLLMDSEEKFSRAFNINPSAMSIRTFKDGVYVDINEAFLKLFGVERGMVIGKTANDLGMVTEKPYEDKISELVLTEGSVKNFELIIRTVQGRVIYCLISIDVIVINESAHILEVLTDITDRKKFEAAMASSERKYRLLFETAGDAILFLDGGIFIDCNKKAEEIYGCYRDKLIGSTPIAFSPEFQYDGEPSAEKGQKKIEAAYHGTPQFFEWTHCRSDGEMFDAEISLNAFETDEKRYVVAIVRDISERKKYELRISHMQKMDAIGQLAGGVAHDFNNQLSGILGYAEILSSRLSDSPLKKYADNIVSVTMRSADLTRKLLAFARKGHIQVSPVNIHSLIDETSEMLKHSIDKRIKVEKIFEADSIVVNGDFAQLQSVFLNLGVNARDAMPEGGILTFKTEKILIDHSRRETGAPGLAGGSYIIISVSDTGTGMHESVKKHLFEPFFTTKDSGKGTGMGLASVYGTVKNHNGVVTVYSEVGYGSTFRVYLPLSSDSSCIETRSGIDDDITIPAQRMLIVDDEDSVRLPLAELLRAMGHDVVEAADGKEGVSIYSEKWRDIDLVIIDMIMPGVSGHDAFRQMKGINPGIRSILASGFSMDSEARSMLADGVLGFIQKPYRKSDLIKKISEVIGKY